MLAKDCRIFLSGFEQRQRQAQNLVLLFARSSILRLFSQATKTKYWFGGGMDHVF
jgi:hypothetical protein